jgi:hypothetical protein
MSSKLEAFSYRTSAARFRQTKHLRHFLLRGSISRLLSALQLTADILADHRHTSMDFSDFFAF